MPNKMISAYRIKIYQKEENGKKAEIPIRATEGSVAFDLKAYLPDENPIFLTNSEVIKVPTGIYIEMPPEIFGDIRPRSGLSTKDGILIINSPGTIDSDFRGEISINLINTGLTHEIFKIEHGDRIAQIIFQWVPNVVFQPVENLDLLSKTNRGEGGFGHTGLQ